jgi:hypothetical protein
MVGYLRLTIPFCWLVCLSALATAQNTAVSQAEIDDYAKQLVDRYYTKCGDQHYYSGILDNGRCSAFPENLHIKECRSYFKYDNLTVHPPVETSLSPADRLNGFEWEGSITVTSAAEKWRDVFNGQWGPWSDWISSSPTGIEFWRKNGVWSSPSDSKGASAVSIHGPLPCSDLTNDAEHDEHATGQTTAISQDEIQSASWQAIGTAFTKCEDRFFFGLVSLPYDAVSCIGIAGPQERAAVKKCQGVIELNHASFVTSDATTDTDRLNGKWVGIIKVVYTQERVRRVTNNVWGKWEDWVDKPADADSTYIFRIWKRDGKWSQENGNFYNKLAPFLPVEDIIDGKPSCADILNEDAHPGRPAEALTPVPPPTSQPGSSISPPQPPIPDGSLIKSLSSDEVYVIQEHKRHHIPNPCTLGKRGWSFTQVKVEPAAVVNSIPLGAPVPIAPACREKK